ncbi:MAG TPA: spore coat U domain-containing protein [Luteimonas sp.]|nr:spore coat U domain-containing protein [Luteimonas sp.]
MSKTRLFLALCCATATGSAFAAASPQTANFQVTANVASSCTVSATDIAFNAYDPADANATAPKDATGTVSVRCTRGTSTAVAALNQGANAATGSTCATPLRQMNGGGTERLRYDIYKEAGRTNPWGCAAANSQAIPTFASSVTPVTLTTYGRIPAGQDAAIGSYTDTVQVSVTF